MSALLSQRPKIFVSYAWTDDHPVPEEKLGWVTAFVQWLEDELKKTLGSEAKYELFRDRKLVPGDELPGEIAHHVQDSAVLIAFLSPAYFESTWCRSELKLFLDKQQQLSSDPGRLIIVNIRKVDAPPVELSKILQVKFWEDHPDSKRPIPIGYPIPTARNERCADKMRDVVYGIQKALESLVPNDVSPAAPKKTVYLAEPSTDLDNQCDELRRLLNEKYRVVPAGVYPNKLSDFRTSVQSDLRGALLFVQLLSGEPGQKFTDSNERGAAVQHALAVEAGMPIVQWRKPGTDPEAVTDSSHKALLVAADEFTKQLEEFKQAVVKRLDKLSRPAESPPAPPAEGFDCTVYVHWDSADDELAEDLLRQLEERRAVVRFAQRTGHVEKDRVISEKRLGSADGIMIVYGNAEQQTVEAQWLYANRVLSQAKKAVPIDVYEGPPPEPPKGDLGIRSLNYHVLRCADGLRAEEIDLFLKRVRATRRDA
ncbi:MAG TPA: toll/interleukin-1 receptor domain-containing protein [Gemmataceae bacterium]|jgi:hypothetical protein|nr:toll/interleukin-1 receptor domain-containing protein [Gemmataceae bacterium]